MFRRQNTPVTRPVLALILTLGLLAGCGQKGDLYLPPTELQQTQAQHPAKLKSIDRESFEPAIQNLAGAR